MVAQAGNFTVEYDPALTGDDLANAESGTDYFLQLYARAVPPDPQRTATLRWSRSGTNPLAGYKIAFQETDGDGAVRGMFRLVRPFEMGDAVSRRYVMATLLGDVLKGRREKVSKRVDQLLKELEEAEDAAEIAG